VISDHHEGLKAAIALVLDAPWQRCCVHFVRNMHGHCRPAQRGLLSAALREVFNATDRQEAGRRLTDVLARLASIAPKVCQLLEAAEEDLLAFMAFPPEHWSTSRDLTPRLALWRLAHPRAGRAGQRPLRGLVDSGSERFVSLGQAGAAAAAARCRAVLARGRGGSPALCRLCLRLSSRKTAA